MAVTTTLVSMSMTTIEALWAGLRLAGAAAQRRVDADHPCDLYADIDATGRVGLIAICASRPIQPPVLNVIAVDIGEREDGRFTLRYSLQRASLLPIFAQFCEDIIQVSAHAVTEGADCCETMLERLKRWRALLERDQAGLSRSELLGLIGELVTLEHRFLPVLGAEAAVASWQGPFGASHDFLLRDGSRIETKTIAWQADSVRISSLAQLDLEAGPITLAVVRVQLVDSTADRAITAPRLIAKLRAVLSETINAARGLEDALIAFGWHEHARHDELALRIVRIEAHAVDDSFPRITASMMPTGVSNVAYDALLPRRGYATWFQTHEA
jgi:hypothetical protein